MHMLSPILSIERDEIHGNTHKCGKTYSEFTKSLKIRSNKYSVWNFDLIFWTREIVDKRNVS